MKPFDQQPLQHLLTNCQSQLGQLAQKVTELQQINQQLQNILSPQLKPHCSVANLRAGCLVIAVSSSNWQTYLRFETSEILKKLQHACPLYCIKELRFIICPHLTNNRQIISAFRPHLSTTSAAMIKATAIGIDDENLRQALLKLAQNAN